MFVAAVAQGLILDSAADLVKGGVGGLYDVERVCYLAGAGNRCGVRAPAPPGGCDRASSVADRAATERALWRFCLGLRRASGPA